MGLVKISILTILVSSYVFGASKNYMPKDCGTTRLQKMNIKTRILNGEKAKLGQFPWLARIGVLGENGRITFYGTGSLINRYYVVTVAFFSKFQNSKVSLIRIGDNYDGAQVDCDETGVCAPPHQDIKPKRTIPIESYNPFSSENDIMLIELELPATFNDFVRPICLVSKPIPIDTIVGKEVFVPGWGLSNIKHSLSYPYKLRFASLPVVEVSKCSVAQYSKTVFCTSRGDDQQNEEPEEEKIPLPQMPTLMNIQGGIENPMANSKGICMGDTGAPASFPMETEGVVRYYLLGIGLFTHPMECGHHSPFTNATNYTDFIVKHVQKG